MIVGMRVRGGLLAALMMFALPVAVTLAAGLVSSSALAQTVDSIQVEGNRRVEVATIRSYFKPGPGGQFASFDPGCDVIGDRHVQVARWPGPGVERRHLRDHEQQRIAALRCPDV